MSNIPFIIVAVIIILYIIASVRAKRLDIATSFAWLIFCIVMLILAIFPYSIDYFAKLLGINYPPALLLLGCTAILFIMSFIQDKKIAELKKKNNTLAQEISLLKSKKNGKK